MKIKKPDLREVKRRSFVSDQGGDIRLVSSIEEKQIYLEDNSIREDSRTDVKLRCEICGSFVASYGTLEGEKLGFACGCLERRVRKILSDQWWSVGSHNQKDIERASELRHLIRQEKGSGLPSFLRRWFR